MDYDFMGCASTMPSEGTRNSHGVIWFQQIWSCRHHILCVIIWRILKDLRWYKASALLILFFASVFLHSTSFSPSFKSNFRWTSFKGVSAVFSIRYASSWPSPRFLEMPYTVVTGRCHHYRSLSFAIVDSQSFNAFIRTSGSLEKTQQYSSYLQCLSNA